MFYIISHSSDKQITILLSEEFTSLQLEIVMKRVYNMYLVQVYLPSSLLVILSWLSFWIDREAVLARVSLGSLCVVSIITQATGLMDVVPGGVRAIDVWEAMCIMMIFLAMLEFASMHFMCRMRKKHEHYVRMSKQYELDEVSDWWQRWDIFWM